MAEFNLDSRLQRDCRDLGCMGLSRLLLLNDCRYPWFLLVPQVPGVTEIHHLSGEQRQRLLDESYRLSCWMEKTFHYDKLNVAAIGNVVNQLHLHHVARRIGDPAWPGPVWGHSTAQSYSPVELESLIDSIQEILVFSERGCV